MGTKNREDLVDFLSVSHFLDALLEHSQQDTIPAANYSCTGSLGTGKGPEPVLGFVVSSMVVGLCPFCLLVPRFKSGCSVKFSKGKHNNMGKQVEVGSSMEISILFIYYPIIIVLRM